MDLIDTHHKQINGEDLQELVNKDNSEDDDITTNCSRKLKALAQILKLLIEMEMVCGDDKLDEHSDCS